MNRTGLLLVAMLSGVMGAFAQEQPGNPDDYVVSRGKDAFGKEFVKIIVPGKPPDKYHAPVARPSRNAVMLPLVPGFSWSFGCSATAAAMAAGFYDNNGYPDMYVGPTNGGFVPMDNNLWGRTVINGEPRDLCPLSATHSGLDGRTARGHVDDYWIVYGNPGPDPYIVNGWTQHSYADCTGDFMGTNQSALGNSDGSTTFTFFVDGSPFSGTTLGDGCYGMKLFFESRGYVVTGYFSQYIYGLNGNTLGFTFNHYKNEIDNGRPVLIQVSGHTMLGIGYNANGDTVYLHDTWDYSTHWMVWGTSYAAMAHYGVSVVQLAPSTESIVANFSANSLRQGINTTFTLSDWTWGSPVSWNWSIAPATFVFVGGTSATSPNPQVQFTAGGLYTVTLTASDGVHSDAATKLNYLEAVDCAGFPFPLEEDFSERALPLCWTIVDHVGNGQVWHFNNPNNWPINTTTAYNGFAMLDSDHFGGGNNQNTDLVTPLLDLSDYVTVNLAFEHYFKEWSGSSGTLSYSINGGSTWSAIQTWTAETANAEAFSQDVSTLVAGHAAVQFKWNYTGEYGYFWVVDDVSITGTMPGLWTGAISSAWNTAGNWSTGVVPGNTTDVTLPRTAVNWPVYSGNLVLGTNCRDLILNGASCLSVTGNLTVPAGRQVDVRANGQVVVGEIP
jgi:PKD repeat protein